MSWRARLSKVVNEMRVIYCAESQASKGTRDFISEYYPDLKTLNPGLPVYVRPCQGAEPSVSVRYDRGVYETRSTKDMQADEVLETVRLLAVREVTDGVQFGGGGAPAIPEVI